MSISYTLSQNQLKVLLKGTGYRAVIGVLRDQTPLEDETVLTAINEMVIDGLLSESDSGFEMTPLLKRMITALGDAQECYALTAAAPSLPDKCLYVDASGERILCATMRSISNHITLTEMSSEEFVMTLFDEGYLSQERYELLPGDDEAAAFEQKAFDKTSLYASLDRESPVLLSIELIRKDMPEKRYIRVMDYYLCNYVVCCCKGRIIRFAYNEETIKTLIFKMMKNDLC